MRSDNIQGQDLGLQKFSFSKCPCQCFLKYLCTTIQYCGRLINTKGNGLVQKLLECNVFHLRDKTHHAPSRSTSLKTPSAVGAWETSFVAGVGAAGATSGVMKGFQALLGQWKGSMCLASGASEGESSKAGAEVAMSSSEDSSLSEASEGDGGETSGDEVMGTSIKMFLSGDQPGGRRLVNNWREEGTVSGFNERRRNIEHTRLHSPRTSRLFSL